MRKRTWQPYFCKVMLLALLVTCSLWQPTMATAQQTCQQGCAASASQCRTDCGGGAFVCQVNFCNGFQNELFRLACGALCLGTVTPCQGFCQSTEDLCDLFCILGGGS
jgi:hypothetical protein